MAFDYAGAKQAGFSDEEIAASLARTTNFDLARALGAGHTYDEILPSLLNRVNAAAPSAPAERRLTEEELRRKYGIGAEEAPEGPTMGGEFGRSVESLLSSLRTTGAAAFGDEEEAALAGLERQQQIGEEYGEGPSLERVKRAYEEDGLLSAAGEAISQIPSAVAGQLPIMGALAAGAMAGQAAIPVPLLGGAIGAATVGIPLFFGSDIERQAETQLAEGVPVDINTGRALAAAAGQTALESVGTAATLGKGIVKSILKIADDTGLDSAAARDLTGAALAKLRGQAATSVTMGARAKAAGRGAGISALAEMPTEVAQQVLERAQAGLDVLSPEAFAEYGEAAYLAGIAGGTLGGATRVGEPGRTQRRAETRLRGLAEEEAQDLFTAERERQGADGIAAGMQPDLLGEIAPVMAPQTAAGAAQQEAAQQQDLLGEEYTTRAGEERFAPPGIGAEPTLPMIATEGQAFQFMKDRGLTKAVEPKMLSEAEQKTLGEVKNYLNEALIMQRVAAEAPRVPRAEGEAPLVIDPNKPISELNAEEQDVLDRVLGQLTSRQRLDKGKGQQPLSKALTNVLVGEEATLAKGAEQEKEMAAAKKQQDREAVAAERAAKKAVEAEEKSAVIRARQEAQRQAAAQKEADRVAKEQQRQQAAARTAGIAEVAPKEMDLLASARPPIERVLGTDFIERAQRDIEAAAAKQTKLQAGRPAPVAPTPTPSVLPKERAALRALFPGASGALGIFAENGPLAGRDISNPAEAAKVKADLETAAQKYSGKNATAVETFLKRPEFQVAPVQPATTQPSEETRGQTEAIQAETQERQVGQEAPETTDTVEPTTAGTAFTAASVVEREGKPAPKKKGVKEPKALTTEQRELKATDEAYRDVRKAVKQVKDLPPEVPFSVTNAEPVKDDAAAESKTTKASQAETVGALATPNQNKTQLREEIRRDTEAFEATPGKKVTQLPYTGPTYRQVLNSQERRKRGPMSLENAAASPKLEGDLLAAVQAGDLKKTVSLLITKMSGRPEAQQIMRRIQSLGLKTKVVIAEMDRPGEYDPVTDTITLSPELGLNEHTLVHELGHAALAKRIADPKSKEAKEFGEFFSIVQNQLGGAYGGKDLQEFAAEIMGNEAFATALKAIKAPKGGNLLQKIVQSIAEFLGFRKGTSVYDEGIKYINKLLNVPASLEPTVIDKLYMGTPTSAEDALRQIGGMRKPATMKQFDEARNVLERAKEKGVDFLRETFFRSLRMHNIYHMYKDAGPKFRPFVRALKQLMSALEKRTGFIEHWIDDANKKYVKFAGIARQYPEAMRRMFNLAEQARLSGIDFLPGSDFKPTPQQQETYDRLSNVLKNLPPPVRDMYLTMRKDYDAAYVQYREFMLAQYADNPTLYKEMRQKFEAENPVAGYVPFMRFGDFVLEYTDPKNGRRTVQQFETRKDRTDAIAELKLPAGEFQEYSRLDQATYDPNKIPSSPFLIEAMKGLEAKGATKQQLDAVYQAYLSMFPAQSIAKRMMRSENVAGMSDDMIRAYANTMVQWARHMGNAMYTPQIDEALDTVASQRDVDDNLQAISKVLNSEASRDFMHNPTYKGWVSSLSGVSYGAFILGNISSAVMNLTSLTLFGLPVLGARYGYDSASAALTAATKLVTPFALKDMTGKENVWAGMPAKYKKLFEVLNDYGQLQHTQTREILAGRTGETQIETNPLKRAALAAMDYGSRPFSATEKVNRAAIALAAYDLALKGGGGAKPMGQNAAIQYALDVVKQVNTSGMAVTGPQLFQTDIGRIFGTFKTFAWNGAFVVAKSFYDSVKGETPEVRRIATRQLLGTMTMAGAISGVSGMPFVMMVTGATRALLAALFGDDEDDDKFITTDEWAREYVNDLFWKGPLNYLTNTAIADRAAITENLFFREDPKLVDDVGYVRATLLQAMGGPAVGYFGNIGDGVKLANEGHYGRALEKILPSSLGNIFKAWRFASEEGAFTKDGKLIMEDINAYNIVMQAIGLAPADLSDMYERRGQAMDVQEKVRKRKEQLLDLAWAAQQSGDEETFAEVREKLLLLSRNHPGTVQKDTIERSFRGKASNMRDSVTGLSFDRALRAELLRRFRLSEE